jgi:hypothetical protein
MLESVRSISIESSNDSSTLLFDNEQVAATMAMIECSAELLREITSEWEDEGFEVSEVADTAFLARTQVSESLEHLKSALSGESKFAVALQVESGLHRTIRALTTIEGIIREFEELPPSRGRSAVTESIAIRRAYFEFRRQVLGLSLSEPNLESRFRSAAALIANLRTLKVYPLMRFYDRMPLRRLQERILGFLGPESNRSFDVGNRIWGDLVAFAELLLEINDREDLLQHDTHVVSALVTIFTSSAEPQGLTALVRAEIESLIGRDDGLNRLIQSQDDIPPNRWIPVLERVQVELETRTVKRRSATPQAEFSEEEAGSSEFFPAGQAPPFIDRADAIEAALRIPGVFAAAVADRETGECSAGQSRANAYQLPRAVLGFSKVIRAKLKVLADLELNEQIHDMIFTSDKLQHVIAFKPDQSCFFLVALNRDDTSLALTRHKTHEICRRLWLQGATV